LEGSPYSVVEDVVVEAGNSEYMDDGYSIQRSLNGQESGDLTQRTSMEAKKIGAANDTSNDEWSMFRHDLNNTGHSNSTAPETNNLLWNYTVGSPVISSPAVADGKVYIGSHDHNVYCLNSSTGELIWNYTTGDGVWSSPAVAYGMVYVGSLDNNVYCFGSGYILKVKTLDNSGNVLPSCNVTIDGIESAISDANGWASLSGMTPGTYVLTTRWQGNIVNQTTLALPALLPMPQISIDVYCQVYSSSFLNSFRDSSGNTLYITPSSFKLLCPNGTTSESLSTEESYLIQNGTTKWNSIIWQGTEVAPENATFDATNGNPTVNCMVYFLTVDPIFYDNTGTTLVQPSSWSIEFPNGTITTVSSTATYNQTQTGNYSIVSIIWKGTEVVPETTPTTTLTSDKLWSPNINCLLPTSISISLSSSTSYVGFKVEINGNLTCNEVSLSGASILLSYSVTSGESWNDITSVNTASDGNYSAMWMPSATGNYLVRATWSGNSTYPGANTTINLAVTQFEEQNVFSVTSNSTVSELAFNSTSRELSFTVTGPSGTIGYINVHIAKTLIDNIADVTVYLDGDQLNYTVTSIDDSWRLHFTYLHSTHEVTISLGDISAPFIENPLEKILIYGVPITAIIILVTFYIYKKKHTRTLSSARNM